MLAALRQAVETQKQRLEDPTVSAMERFNAARAVMADLRDRRKDLNLWQASLDPATRATMTPEQMAHLHRTFGGMHHARLESVLMDLMEEERQAAVEMRAAREGLEAARTVQKRELRAKHQGRHDLIVADVQGVIRTLKTIHGEYSDVLADMEGSANPVHDIELAAAVAKLEQWVARHGR